MATTPTYRKTLTEEDAAAVERYLNMYDELAKSATASIDQQYAPTISAQKSQLAALPTEYDTMRHQNDYELEVATRRMQDMLAMERQQNSGMSRTEMAGLQAAHAQTAGSINAQQKIAEAELRNAISKILAEREQAKAETRLKYQEKGVKAATDRAEELLDNYREDAVTALKNEEAIKQIMLKHDNTLSRDAILHGYDEEEYYWKLLLEQAKNV